MRILLLPPNPSGERVIECLVAWSRSGLIEPFAWCVAEPGRSSPDREVSRVEAGETQEMLLGAALQGAVGATNELVAFYPATEAEGFDTGFVAAAADHVELLARTIAHDAARPARCTMVIAPAEIGQPVPPQMLSQSFASNVYVAPEDRAEPRDPNRLLGNAEVFPLHSAHAIATVADLWAGPGSGKEPVLDVLANRQPHSQLAIQVIRCFSRGIDFGYLPDQVSAGIFHGDGGWPNPDKRRFDRVASAERVIPFVADEYVEQHREEIGLSDFDPPRLAEPEPFGLLEAFLLLLKLIVARIRRKPFEAVRRRVESWHDSAADWVERKAGPDTGIRVRHMAESGVREEGVAPIEDVIDKPLVVPDGPVAEVWTALRRLVFGLVDGSELPEGVDLTRLVNGRDQRALVTDPRALAPDPDSPAPPIDDGRGPICDPLRLDPSLVTFEEADGGEAKDEESERRRAALEEWGLPHRSSLLWRVGLRIGVALRTAQSEAAMSVPAAAAEGDGDLEGGSLGEQRRSVRKRLRRTLIMASLIALIAAAIAAGQLPVVGIAIAILVIAVGWFCALANAARRWLLADEAIVRGKAEAERARLNAALKIALRKGDAIRLQRRYDEYLDWAEMLARLVHKPWVGDPLDQVKLRPPIDYATLPAAFSVAVADVTELELERLSAAAGTGVFATGWLAGVYDFTERREMIELGIRGGLTEQEAEVERPDPAADIGEDRGGPRRVLLDAIRRGSHRSLSVSEFGEDVLRYLSARRLDRVCERVAVLPTADGAAVGAEIDALPPPLAGFEPPESLPRLAEELRPTVVWIECGGGRRAVPGSGVVVDSGMVATALEVVAGASTITLHTADGEQLEATLARADPQARIALLSFDGGELQATSVPAAAEIVQGDPAISLDRPFVGRAGSDPAWGLVTVAPQVLAAPDAPDTPLFRVSYHRATGTPGAPVFDLAGRLLGIHCGRSFGGAGEASGSGQRTSVVVPSDAVRRLIEAPGDIAADPSPPPPTGLAAARAFVAPTEFVEGLTRVDPPPALLIHHWKDAQKKNDTTEVIPASGEGPKGSNDLASLVAGIEFFAPLRVLVHRVDLVAPSSVRDLASFPEVEVPDADRREPDDDGVPPREIWA
jgi:hypothetical protein